VFTGTTCKQVVCRDGAPQVAQLDARTLGGRRLTVRGKRYVLACGGLETTRLLLASPGPGGREIGFPPNAPVLFYLQRLRDEAHRFAIGAHRAKRAKSFTASPLDEVPGIGPNRKRALLMHFGTARAVRNAALEDIEKVPGISRTTARGIYDYFHPQG